MAPFPNTICPIFNPKAYTLPSGVLQSQLQSPPPTSQALSVAGLNPATSHPAPPHAPGIPSKLPHIEHQTPATIDSQGSAAASAGSHPAEPYACPDCAGLVFECKEAHDNYLTILGTACPDNLCGRKCREWSTCRTLKKLCYKINTPAGCPFSNEILCHRDYMHTKRHCKNDKLKIDCGKNHELRQGRNTVIQGQLCYQLVQQWHLKTTCHDLAALGECQNPECKLGHDHLQMRYVIQLIREQHAELNMEHEEQMRAAP